MRTYIEVYICIYILYICVYKNVYIYTIYINIRNSSSCTCYTENNKTPLIAAAVSDINIKINTKTNARRNSRGTTKDKVKMK